MRIHPPKLVILDTEPFLADLLKNRKKFGDTLSGLFRRMDKDENLVVLVDAPWGGGKSTFIEMWEKSLKNPRAQGDAPAKPVHLIRFDAFAADHHEDPFVAFSGEVVEFINAHHTRTLGEKADALIQSAARIAVKFAKPLFNAAVRMGSGGLIDGDVAKDLAKDATDIAADALVERIKKYGEERKSIAAFKATLAQVAAKVREDQDFPLVIVVDELDRCRPDFALKLLERIKHLFDVPGVAFLLFAHKAQLEEMIRHAYGREVDANAYLHKFVNITTRLANDGHMSGHKTDAVQYCLSLAPYYGWENCPPERRDLLVNAIELTNPTLRETEKIFALISVSQVPLKLTFENYNQEMLFYLLAAIKVKHHDIYRRIKASIDTHEELLPLLHIERQSNSWHVLGLPNDLMRYWIVNAFAAPEVREAKKPASFHGSFFGNAQTKHIVARHVQRLDVFEIA